MSDVPRDDKPKVFTLINGEIRESQISFRSVSDLDGEIRVHTVEGDRIDVRVPGANFALRFDLEGVQKVPAAPEREPAEDKKESAEQPLTPFNWKTLLITFVLWNVVGVVISGVVGLFVALLYFGYQWREVAKRKKQLADDLAPETTEVKAQAQETGSKMSRERVHKALSRKR